MVLLGSTLVYSQSTTQDQAKQDRSPIVVPVADEQALQIGDAPNTENNTVQSGITFWTVFRLVLVLGLSVAAIYGITYWLKSLAHPAELRDPYLRVIATTHLGSNRSVHIVAVGTKAWLVGSAEGSVQPIAEITEQETLDALFLDESKRLSETGKTNKDFKSILSRFMPQAHSERQNSKSAIALNTEGLKKQRERLRGL